MRRTDITAPARARKVLAFHSYKGGTGKTTFVANLGAFYAEMGLRVLLLDFDMYAPSFTTYFQKTPRAYLIDYLTEKRDIADVLVDVSDEIGVKGKLYLGLSCPSKDAIQTIDAKDAKWHYECLEYFQNNKSNIFEDYDLDYILIDTSPGVRIWSINGIGAANTIFLLLKINDMDIEGTKSMIKEIYSWLTKHHTQFFLILNKVPGAVPLQDSVLEDDFRSWEIELEREIGTRVIGSVPCFCDIQFSRHEFLFTINRPDHPFSQKLQNLAQKIQEAT